MHDATELPTFESLQKHGISWGYGFQSLIESLIAGTFAAVISDQTISDILAATNLADLIGEYVTLTSRSGSPQACCPFHNEKTPSFTVFDDHYHCFGCNAHGNAIEFLENHLGLSFPDAVRALAARAGIAVVTTPAEKRTQDTHRWLIDTNRSAHAVYQRLLYQPEHDFALQDLRARGIDDDSIARFGIGFAPDRWTTLTGDPSFKEGNLIKAGLAKPRSSRKGAYDFFRDRLMFPVHNRQGSLVGFSGRVVQGKGPKYLNTEETPIYHKGSVLFGFTQAAPAIRKHGYVVVVEGVFDVITPAQNGFENILSTCGTALTEDQIDLLLSLSRNVVFCFDGDSAGAKATWRAAEMMVEKARDHHEVRLCIMPPEHDPDTLVRTEGLARFVELVQNAPTLTQYLVQTLVKANAIPEAQVRALIKAKSLYNRFASPLLATLFRQFLCEQLLFPLEQFDLLGASQTNDDTEIAACPFCAAIPAIEELSGYWRIQCACGISTKQCFDVAAAKALWNRRPQTSPLTTSPENLNVTPVPA